MTHEDSTPRIYVGCLAAYNNDKLYGEWIDCDQNADDIQEEINAMLADSPEPGAEEWAIHDFENWHGIKIGENEDIERIAELARLIEKHGKAFALYCQYHNDEATEKEFQEHYAGQYEDEEDFVYQSWEDSGMLKKLEEINVNSCYIDWKVIARDWFISDYFSVEAGYKETYVFSCH